MAITKLQAEALNLALLTYASKEKNLNLHKEKI